MYLNLASTGWQRGLIIQRYDFLNEGTSSRWVLAAGSPLPWTWLSMDKYGKSATRSVGICSILKDNKASVNKLAVGLGGRVSSPQDVAF